MLYSHKMRITEYIQKKTQNLQRRFHRYPRVLKWVGYSCIIIGVLAFFTPFTPGSWLALVGIEILGIRAIVMKKMRPYLSSIHKSFKE
jgi:uncharacterized membrane protein HdeD (DUF308 family)